MLLTGRNREPAPAGQFAAVCVDVVDLGAHETEWRGQARIRHTCRLVWELEAARTDGRRHLAMRTFTASLDEKSALRPFLEAWRGKPFTADELKGFDAEVLVGVGAQLQIVHKTVGDRVYANVNAIMLPAKGQKWLEPAVIDGKPAYVRVKDRPAATSAGGVGPGLERGRDVYEDPEDDDDLPF